MIVLRAGSKKKRYSSTSMYKSLKGRLISALKSVFYESFYERSILFPKPALNTITRSPALSAA